MKLHPYVSDKTLHHFPRSLQNPSGLLRVGDRPGLSTPAHAAGEGGGPGGWQPHVAMDALGPGGSFAGENTGCRRWPGAFCVRTAHPAVGQGAAPLAVGGEGLVTWGHGGPSPAPATPLFPKREAKRCGRGTWTRPEDVPCDCHMLPFKICF